MPARFVILAHSGHGPLHYDLMLQQGDALATWQFEADPTTVDSSGLPGRRIAGHRTAYLDYEGPVSGGRGEVRRTEAGTWEPTETAEDCWRFALTGRRIDGRYELRRDREQANTWTLRRLS
ncbi:MAG: hypothetical protein GVY16_03015 [Planctomycetes bacterium]|jgi:hypothetical protein|nr:hypothetical protein [Phycisphaerae bacterium]NBB94689.1 hypothetical protein [Planctomycetota bacterium]